MSEGTFGRRFFFSKISQLTQSELANHRRKSLHAELRISLLTSRYMTMENEKLRQQRLSNVDCG